MTYSAAPNEPSPQYVYCPICHKKLFRVLREGGQIEIKCTHCKTIIRWPSSQATEIIVPSR